MERMAPGRSRGRVSRYTVLAVLGLTAIPATAQEAGKVRRVVLARVTADHPATITGAVDKPLYLVFDGAVGPGAIRAPGVAVRRAAPHVLVLMPSRAAARAPVPVSIPLQVGAAAFVLVVKAETTDTQILVYRSGDPGSLLAQRAQRSLIGVLAVQPVKVEPTNASVPDANVKCRMGLRVQSPVIPQGATVEIRTPDSSLCESARTFDMRVGSGR
jgi:hypothetical protein